MITKNSILTTVRLLPVVLVVEEGTVRSYLSQALHYGEFKFHGHNP